MIAHPFVKWVGGKTFLLPEILKRLPVKINTYYEPFVGGGAVFFELYEMKHFKHAVLNDSNAELIIAYATLQDHPYKLIETLSKHVYEEKRYYKVRALNPTSLNQIARAARFIYLNKTCFNGLYRVNKKGQFNVPFGRYVNPTICDEERLLASAGALRMSGGVKLTKVDFAEAVAQAKRGDAVYFDPPYVPVSDTANFTAYSKTGFTELDHTRLRDTAKALAKKGVHVLLSNSDTPFVRKLYRGFKIEEVQAPRRVNSKGNKRGNVGELLISGRKTK